MPTYQIVEDSTGLIKSTITVTSETDPSIRANTPSGCSAIGPTQDDINSNNHSYDKNTKKFKSKNSVAKTLTEYEDEMLDIVDSIRESTQMRVLSPGGAKKMVYSAKQMEFTDYFKLGSAAVALLNLQQLKARFPYAFAEMSLTNDSLANVMTRWSIGQTISLSELHRIEAIAVTAKRQIKAATTLVAKQDIFNKINWAWKPTV